MPATPLVALEIGTHRVRVVTGEAQANHHLVITGIGECASRGVRKSEIVDFDNALACVKAALQLAEEQAQLVIGQVHLLFSGGAIRSLINRGTVPVLNPAHVITREEIDDARENARAVSLAADREVIHSISQHFFIDDQAMVINAEGMEGARLCLDMLLLHGVRNRIRNIVEEDSYGAVIIDCSAMFFIDIEGADMLKEINADLAEHSCAFYLVRLPERALAMLAADGVVDVIGAEHICQTIHDALAHFHAK